MWFSSNDFSLETPPPDSSEKIPQKSPPPVDPRKSNEITSVFGLPFLLHRHWPVTTASTAPPLPALNQLAVAGIYLILVEYYSP
jgi:hypothetical protein